MRTPSAYSVRLEFVRLLSLKRKPSPVKRLTITANSKTTINALSTMLQLSAGGAPTVPHMSEPGNDAPARRFAPGWKMAAFVAVFLPLTIALGFWQIARGHEKQRMEEQFLAGQGRLPVDAQAAASAAPFTRVRLRGRYDPQRYFLLDNQV